METDYNKTLYACFIAYIVQAIVNNFVPLLFLTFQSSYGIPLAQITLLVTINFGVQLLVDLAAMAFVDKIGYRAAMLLAHFFAVVGLASLTVLPGVFADPFVGLLMAVIIYAAGGGLLEVLVSPTLEACPTPNKEKAMSLLHSFYCWGHMGVVLISTIFFWVFGISNWKVLALLWAAVPFVNFIVFMKVPFAPLLADGEMGMKLGELFRQKIFWMVLLMMVCAGASEQSVSQWVSAFAEKGLHVSKTIGDLAGPMMFALLMGLSRLFYGKFGDRINLEKFMAASVVLCLACYLCISLVPNPVISLLGCGVCGFSVGILWPGTFSLGAAALKNGGTSMFALMALAGDLGCSGGPTLVGMVSDYFGGELRVGILAAAVFPVVLLGGIWYSGRGRKVGQ